MLTRIAFAMSLVALTASCAQSPYFVLLHEKKTVVLVDGVGIAVAPGERQNEYSAFNANPGLVRYVPSIAREQELLTRGVEKATGCKVTTASMVPDTHLLQALVKC